MNLYCAVLEIDVAPRIAETAEEWAERQERLLALPDEVFLAKIRQVWDTTDLAADYYDVGFGQPGNSVRFKAIGPQQVRRWTVEDGLALIDAAYGGVDDDWDDE